MEINSNFYFKSLPFLKVGKHPAMPNHYRPVGLSDYCHSYSGCTNQRQWKSSWFCRLLKDLKRYRFWWKISLFHMEACPYCSPHPSNHYQGWRWLSATNSGPIPTKKNILIFLILYPTRHLKNGNWLLEQLPQCFNSGVSL